MKRIRSVFLTLGKHIFAIKNGKSIKKKLCGVAILFHQGSWLLEKL